MWNNGWRKKQSLRNDSTFGCHLYILRLQPNVEQRVLSNQSAKVTAILPLSTLHTLKGACMCYLVIRYLFASEESSWWDFTWTYILEHIFYALTSISKQCWISWWFRWTTSTYCMCVQCGIFLHLYSVTLLQQCIYLFICVIIIIVSIKMYLLYSCFLFTVRVFLSVTRGSYPRISFIFG